MANHFQTLGVQFGASHADVKKAFRALALRYHPDRLAGAPETVRVESAARFKAITEAYEVLSDEGKRAAYMLGQRTGAGTGARGYGGGAGSAGGYAYGHNAHAHARQYEYSYTQRPRTNTWTTFARRLSSKPAEAALFTVLSLMGLGGIYAVDAAWHWRNKGKQFTDIHRTRLMAHDGPSFPAGVGAGDGSLTAAEDAAGGVGGEGDELLPGWVTNPLRNAPAGCGVRSRPYTIPYGLGLEDDDPPPPSGDSPTTHQAVTTSPSGGGGSPEGGDRVPGATPSYMGAGVPAVGAGAPVVGHQQRSHNGEQRSPADIPLAELVAMEEREVARWHAHQRSKQRSAVPLSSPDPPGVPQDGGRAAQPYVDRAVGFPSGPSNPGQMRGHSGPSAVR